MARAVFMGSDEFSVPILEGLLRRGPSLQPAVTICGVVTRPDRRDGRGRELRSGPVKRIASLEQVPVLQPERLRDEDAVDSILDLEPDVIVVASFGQILPRRLLDAPPRHAINLHPSLLPKFRGPSPVAGAILAGDPITGTTLMLMTPRMDAGPILAQEETAIDNGENRGELDARLAQLSARMLLRNLPAWLEDRLPPMPQDETAATYTSLLTKEDAAIDWALPAADLARRVRAYNPWPVAWTIWRDAQLRILSATAAPGQAEPGRVIESIAGGPVVGTGDGLLLLERVQLAGGRPLDAVAFVQGHRSILGAELGK